MYQQVIGFVRGAALGVAAGVAVAAVGRQMLQGNRHLRHDTQKAMHAVGHVVGDVQHMLH